MWAQQQANTNSYLQQRQLGTGISQGGYQSYQRQSYGPARGMYGAYGGGSNYGSTGSGYGSSGAGYGSTGAGYGSTGSSYGSKGGGYGTAPTSLARDGGYGHGGHYASYSGGYEKCPGIPLALLLITLAGVVVMGVIFFLKVQAAGRRKKRSSEEFLWEDLLPMAMIGLEEFEEKIDAIAEGEDDGETSWISKIYNQFSFFNDGDNSVEEADMEGLEPPLLDTTWGLGQRTKGISANATIEDAVELDQDANDNANRTKRAIKEEEEVREDDSEEKCRTEMWRCLSKVIEGGLHYMDQPQGILGLAKKTMFKIAFHGGFSNVWSGVMTIPEARQIKQCMTAHTSCVSYEILRREAQQTMDPTDPMVTMYNKEKMEEKEEKEDRQDNTKEKKRERLIINPEFVEGMDTGDGSLQYDEDYSHNQI